MPEYRCKNCGKHFFGWGARICRFCGSELEAINESAKRREISEEKKVK